MAKIFDRDGNELAEFDVSEKKRGLLERGEEVTITFTTPQTLRATLGGHSGSFALKQIDDRLVATDTKSVRTFAALLKAIKQVREAP